MTWRRGGGGLKEHTITHTRDRERQDYVNILILFINIIIQETEGTDQKVFREKMDIQARIPDTVTSINIHQNTVSAISSEFIVYIYIQLW